MHCLFEQSGTFKNEFIKFGFAAYDYDILNNYGQTDYQIDLFAEIENGYSGKPSIFDRIAETDLIMAFFPCTRFECQCSMNFRGDGSQMLKWDDEKKLKYDLFLFDGLSKNYKAITKMALIAIKRNFKLIIENPANKPHFLTSYWALKPKIIDKDRRLDGDRQRKPTQYWFIGFDPKQNFVMEATEYTQSRRHESLPPNSPLRSEIHPQYANRFIRRYILDGQEEETKDDQINIFDFLKGENNETDD